MLNLADDDFNNDRDVKESTTSDSRKRLDDNENVGTQYSLDWKKRKTNALQDEEKLKSISPLSMEPHSPKKAKSVEISKIHEETAAEREARLKEEEEYRKKRLEKKRKKNRNYYKSWPKMRKKDRRTGEAESLRNGKIGKSYFRESKKNGKGKRNGRNLL